MAHGQPYPVGPGEAYIAGPDGWQHLGQIDAGSFQFEVKTPAVDREMATWAPGEISVTVDVSGFDAALRHFHFVVWAGAGFRRHRRRCPVCNPRGFTTPPSGEFGRHYNQRRKARRRRNRR